MAVSGSQLTRIGGFFSGVAKKLTILAKAAGVVPNPASFAVIGLINSDGQGSLGEVLSNGVGTSVSQISNFAVKSTISDQGQGVTGEITSNGQGITGNI